MSRALHDLVSVLLRAEFGLSDCIEIGGRALLIFEDVEDLRRLLLMIGDEEPSSRFSGRLMVGRRGALPVCIALTKPEMRAVRRHVADYVVGFEAWMAEGEGGSGGTPTDDGTSIPSG